METHNNNEYDDMPSATLDDLHSQNNDMIGLLEQLNTNVRLLREAVYGLTQNESQGNARYNDPKHGEFGVVTESSNQVQSHLAYIGDQMDRIEEGLNKK